MNVYALKLITGEDVVGDLESQSETEFVISNPVGITVIRGQGGEANVGFSPFPIHGRQESCTMVFSKKHVVYSYTPSEDFVKHYEELFSSNLIVPEQKIILG